MGGIVLKSELTAESSAKELSIVIITLNEERNLASLLPDIPKEAEIVIVDSGSSDGTVALAKSFGARVEIRSFDHYSGQKNHALSLATRRWTLCLDADERPDLKLWEEILAVVSGPRKSGAAYSFSRRLVFLGTPLRYGRSKDHVTRLFETNTARYKNEIHEELIHAAGARAIRLGGVLWHWSYVSLDDYFARFNRYTTMMARSRFNAGKRSPNSLILALRIPGDFVSRYILKLGFLDGWHGFLWALFGSFYGFVKYAKLIELHRENAKVP